MAFATTTSSFHRIHVLIFAVLLPFHLPRHVLLASVNALLESDRVAEYHKRNHTWPPLERDFVPNTDGWRRVQQRRLEQVQRIADKDDMYNGFVKTVHSSLISPNFTEYGWAVTRSPQGLLDELLSALHRGLAAPPVFAPESAGTKCINTPHRPLFHTIDKALERRALLELKPIAEAWINHDDRPPSEEGGPPRHQHLIGNNAYGLRIYQNQSRLHMHVDQRTTHIVSAILHVDHDENSKPWPIVIEDFQGNTNEVVLEKGDLLLYESSKCFHGRPRRFEGEWYSSLFIHYYPADWDRLYDEADVHYRIPPGWNTVLPPKPGLETLVMASTSSYEPECEDSWCALNGTKKWDVRGVFGSILSGDGVSQGLGFSEKNIKTPRHWGEEL